MLYRHDGQAHVQWHVLLCKNAVRNTDSAAEVHVISMRRHSAEEDPGRPTVGQICTKASPLGLCGSINWTEDPLCDLRTLVYRGSDVCI